MNFKLYISKLIILLILILVFSCNDNEDDSQPITDIGTGTGTSTGGTGGTGSQTQTGKGDIVSQTLNLNSFNEIEISNYCNVEVVTGTINKVEYSDYENLIQYLKFEVIGNRLVIKTTPENLTLINTQAKAKVYIAGNLTGLFIKGSANINLLSSFNELSQCTISGAGNVIAKSNSTSVQMNCSVSGSGYIDFSKIASQNATCVITGSGSISLAVSDTLKAQITGSGSIRYLGNPTISSQITGSGQIVKL